MSNRKVDNAGVDLGTIDGSIFSVDRACRANDVDGLHRALEVVRASPEAWGMFLRSASPGLKARVFAMANGGGPLAIRLSR